MCFVPQWRRPLVFTHEDQGSQSQWEESDGQAWPSLDPAVVQLLVLLLCLPTSLCSLRLCHRCLLQDQLAALGTAQQRGTSQSQVPRHLPTGSDAPVSGMSISTMQVAQATIPLAQDQRSFQGLRVLPGHGSSKGVLLPKSPIFLLLSVADGLRGPSLLPPWGSSLHCPSGRHLELSSSFPTTWPAVATGRMQPLPVL